MRGLIFHTKANRDRQRTKAMAAATAAEKGKGSFAVFLEWRTPHYQNANPTWTTDMVRSYLYAVWYEMESSEQAHYTPKTTAEKELAVQDENLLAILRYQVHKEWLKSHDMAIKYDIQTAEIRPPKKTRPKFAYHYFTEIRLPELRKQQPNTHPLSFVKQIGQEWGAMRRNPAAWSTFLHQYDTYCAEFSQPKPKPPPIPLSPPVTVHKHQDSLKEEEEEALPKPEEEKKETPPAVSRASPYLVYLPQKERTAGQEFQDLAKELIKKWHGVEVEAKCRKEQQRLYFAITQIGLISFQHPEMTLAEKQEEIERQWQTLQADTEAKIALELEFQGFTTAMWAFGGNV